MPVQQFRVKGTRTVKRVQRPQLATKRYVRKAISASHEQFEQSFSNAAENAAYDGAAIQILTPCSGLAISDKIHVNKVQANFIFTAAAAAGATFVRLIIFQWYKDSNVTAPAVGDLLSPSGTQPSIVSGYKASTMDNSNSVKILKDMVVKLGENTDLTGADRQYRRVTLYGNKLGRKVIKSTGVTGEAFNNVYYCAISDVADASSPPTVQSGGIHYYKGES